MLNNSVNFNRKKSILHFEYAMKRINTTGIFDQGVLEELLQAEKYIGIDIYNNLNKEDYLYLTKLYHFLAKAYENNYINGSSIDEQLILLHKAEEYYIKAKNSAEYLSLGSHTYEVDKRGKIYLDMGVFYKEKRFEKELSKLYLFMARKWFDERNLVASVAECDRYIT